MKSNGKVKKYLELNNKYIRDGDECLKKGDYVQASEKFWGVIATIAKAIAAQRRKTIKSHDGIKFFLVEIARELKDESIHATILLAEGLHQNFYEDTSHPDTVKKGAKIIKQFATRLHNRFNLIE